jgi:predicted nucleic acid-binding protein
MINENIMNKSIYLDTSVFGGYYDDEFKVYTRQFFEKVFNENIIIMVSETVENELKNAPDKVKAFYNSIPKEILKKVDTTEEIKALANKYVKANIITEKYFSDCLHIATATINNADVLVSWNFKHMVNIERKIGYNVVNSLENYKTIQIVTPMEVFDYDIT